MSVFGRKSLFLGKSLFWTKITKPLGLDRVWKRFLVKKSRNGPRLLTRLWTTIDTTIDTTGLCPTVLTKRPAFKAGFDEKCTFWPEMTPQMTPLVTPLMHHSWPHCFTTRDLTVPHCALTVTKSEKYLKNSEKYLKCWEISWNLDIFWNSEKYPEI